MTKTESSPENSDHARLRLVAWEITKSCNLHCAHCRGSAHSGPYHGELSREECFALINDILKVGRPILILTGGEPLKREDFFDVAGYAAGKGIRVVVGSNGTLITKEIATRMKTVPISRLGISLDFPNRELQDKFRGSPGAFDAALAGIECARNAGIEVQINSTITRLNTHYLDALIALALNVGAVAFHPFLLVPTGRGQGLQEHVLSAQEYEHLLIQIYEKQQQLGNRLFFKPTDAPSYMRVLHQQEMLRRSPEQNQPSADTNIRHADHGSMNSMSRGCLGGISFCFISHVGRVQGCGYLDVEAGNIREQPFHQIWQHSPLFYQLRDYSLIKGKCGICEYKMVCGGCRARAYEATGDYLAAEPYCLYQPHGDNSYVAGLYR
ncbi:MAG: radical SAM/SPASM domain-containing protein [Chloroflexi bacterium RBG_13_48_17]|nr:MAG: radical SAM/SPASM domain-containing protein [Chloroflexi bacterium RBG_13_48_17]